MRRISSAILLAISLSLANANADQTTTLEGAILRTVPRGYSVMFMNGVNVERQVELGRHGSWQQRLAAIASRANAIAEIDESESTVRVVANTNPGVTTDSSANPNRTNYVMSAKQGDLLSVALRKSLQSYGYALVWNLKTDLEISIAYTQSQSSVDALCNAIMRDYQLVGTLYTKNRVLVVTDPAIKD